MEPITDGYEPVPATRPAFAAVARLLPDAEIIEVEIASLRIEKSPRLDGIDPGHVRTLAEVEGPLPPIVVHHGAMWVIDGMHRLAAARLDGRTSIDAIFFYGNSDEAFQLAVRANVTHGLPLTQADRQAAAARIVRTHPNLSDRSIAATAGLAARTVATIRRNEGVVDVAMRVGRDGRTRPVNATEGRRLASLVIASQPSASLRKVALAAGVSVGTVRDVRARLAAGQDPVPDRQRGLGRSTHTVRRATHMLRHRPPVADPFELLDTLQRDPALRYSDTGRALLRWLGNKTVPSGQWRGVVDGIPTHSAIMVAKIARGCAAAWMQLADELDQANEGCPVA